MHRFFIPPEDIFEAHITMSGEQAHQVSRVLRLKAGDQIEVLDNAGWEYEVRLMAVSRYQVTGSIIERREAQGEPAVHLSLYMSLLKRDKFEWVLQKGTEVGVSRFVPLVTQRSLVQDIDIKQSKFDRWQKIIQEAAEQSRRGRIPVLGQPIRFAAAMAEVNTAVALIPWEEATEMIIRQALAGKAPESIALFIGPEGGFTAEEVRQAADKGIVAVTLGKRILRAETAAVVAAALTLAECEPL